MQNHHIGVTRQCPVCAVPLDETTYEGMLVHSCPQCAGHLIAISRYECICRKPERTVDELKSEMLSAPGQGGDTVTPIRCPRCRMLMQKDKRSVGGGALTFYVDQCRACRLIWLDGGELAAVQLAFQASPQFRGLQEQQQRALELDSDEVRSKEFDAAQKKLKLPSALDGLFEEVLWELLVSRLRFPFRRK